MEKIDQPRGHCENVKGLVSFIAQLRLLEFTLNLSSFHDKITLGELEELPGELQKKMQTFKVIQELQKLHQKAIGNNHFSQPIMLNLLF